eukprot:4232612-Pyramimonas_sp.AAC.1
MLWRRRRRSPRPILRPRREGAAAWHSTHHRPPLVVADDARGAPVRPHIGPAHLHSGAHAHAVVA